MTTKTSVSTIVNVGGGGAALLLAVYALGSYMWADQKEPGCMADYQNIANFAFRSPDGRLMSAIEVQAQAGADERGLMENTQIVELLSGPVDAALEVRLGRTDPADPMSAVGVDFAWRPLGLVAASSACLRYSIWLPNDFEFGTGGSLPGLFGGNAPALDGEKTTEGFAVRPKWTRDAVGEVLAESPVNDGGDAKSYGYRQLAFERGRWTTIEQEVVLNSAGATDGKLRVWKDGVMLVDEHDVKLRDDEQTGISGVVARAGFLARGRGAPTGPRATLQLSPMEIGWR
ncbi:MAG: hypothetical protein KDJ37_02575 [Hyphomicrobiaceae bacterium]|nr:hypothetical protein [Hyphomicrobiaceae bacterium]